MGRILAIDYGQKRVGIAVTDSMQMIANGLTTVHSKDAIDFIKGYVEKEDVELFVVGEAKQLNNQKSESCVFIEQFVNKLKKTFPTIPIELIDERFTSKIALQTMIDGGLKKKDRRNKELIDYISATLILQSYLNRKTIKDNL